MTTAPISLPQAAWPPRDRELWEKCCTDAHGLDSPPLASLRASTRKLHARAYGEWLQWRIHTGLPNDGDPGSRFAADEVRSYARWQYQRGLKLPTIARGLQSLIVTITSLCPGVNVKEVRKIANYAKKRARGEHRAKPFIVHAAEMYQYGFELMTPEGHGTERADDLFVDGLMISLLTACPLRISDFAPIRLDQHILRGQRRWRLLVNASKTGKKDYCSLPEDITQFIDAYVDLIRPRLILRHYNDQSGTDRFFIGSSGLPLNTQMMRRRIKVATAQKFGEPILPHSFRKLAVTTLVLEEPEHAASAPSLLGHADPRVTEDHYIIGQQIVARQRYHGVLDRIQRDKASL